VGLSKSFYIEHGVAGGELQEYEYDVEIDGYEPYVPAKISGPPEDCYPEEGGCASAVQGKIRRRITTPQGPWEWVPFSVFLEGYAFSRDIKDDLPEKALDKALQEIEDELYEYAAERHKDAYDDAQEARYDYQRENGKDWDHGDL
jgi:hypothetical protein